MLVTNHNQPPEVKMLFSVSIIAIALGLACLFERDLVWMLYEYDSHLMGTSVERTPRWNQQAGWMGLFFVILGLVGFWAALQG
jgi:hypothetical protein